MPKSAPTIAPPPVVVLGAGVIGLTTAVLLQAAGYHVTVLASHTIESYPDDAVLYASPKAGAHWRSTARADDKQMQGIDLASLLAFRRLLKVKEAGVLPMLSVDVYTHKDEPEPWFKKEVPEYGILAPEHLPPAAVFGFKYTTMSFNSPKYLAWLARVFRRLGGKVVHKKVPHIDDAFHLVRDPHTVVVNCTGLGAMTLGGVEDKDVYPTRGQTVIVRAPQVKYTISRFGTDGTFDYVIPRDDGLVVLGGTYQENQSSMIPDRQTADRIVRNATTICPQLQTYPGQPLEVVAHAVGLRPTRRGGIRLEHEWRRPAKSEGAAFRPAYLAVHNYGHGGGGYQSSWGSAQKVLELVTAQAANPEGVGKTVRVSGIRTYDVALRRVTAVGSIKSRL
ncbi:FAD dependent oxidoreductase [Blastocladiella britannica]|nr:FAD dependent oxidoreductase [Blastocladiella britannica]